LYGSSITDPPRSNIPDKEGNVRRLLYACACLIALATPATAGDTSVGGYIRRDGTYVQPHYRSAPDGDRSNNWSTRGNVNPYTGQPGTRSPDNFSSGSGRLGTQTPNYLDSGSSLQQRRRY
jgi:hypothetical protein